MSSSSPTAAALPKPASSVGSSSASARPRRPSQERDEQHGGHRAGEEERECALQPAAARPGLALLADVRGDEDVEHHHGAGVHDHLGRGDELAVQEQEQHRERHEVDDEREHAVERVLERDDADGARDRDERAQEEQDLDHADYSPSARSGVRSSGSARSISLVKIRSERV